MALLTFTPPVAASLGTKKGQTIKILAADFGDGYSQPTPDGVNHIRKNMSLTWEGLTNAQADTILDFFEGQQGTIPFKYKHFNDAIYRKWTCKVWDDGYHGGRTVTAEFEQSFTLEN